MLNMLNMLNILIINNYLKFKHLIINIFNQCLILNFYTLSPIATKN